MPSQPLNLWAYWELNLGLDGFRFGKVGSLRFGQDPGWMEMS